MRFSYLLFAVAFICLIATAAYRDAWGAAAVFGGAGVIVYLIERHNTPKAP